MAARDVADGVGHRQHGEAEGEGDAEEADPQFRKGRGEDGRTAAAEGQPERTEEFGGRPTHRIVIHGDTSC